MPVAVVEAGAHEEVADVNVRRREQVDVALDPGEAAAREILTLVKRGAISDLVEFANGQLVLLGAYVDPNAAFVGTTLAELRRAVEGWTWLVVAVIRHGETMIARGSTVLEPHDHVLLMAQADRTSEAYEMLGISDKAAEKAIVLGATRIAQITAALLADNGIFIYNLRTRTERPVVTAADLPGGTQGARQGADAPVLNSHRRAREQPVMRRVVDEQHIARLQVGHQRGDIAGLFQHGRLEHKLAQRRLARADFSRKRPLGTTDNTAEQEAVLVELSEKVEDYRELYDAAVRMADERVGSVVDMLKARGVWDNTVIIVMSDHGEEFYEHGYW